MQGQTLSMLFIVSSLNKGKVVYYSAQDGVADLISDQCSREKFNNYQEFFDTLLMTNPCIFRSKLDSIFTNCYLKLCNYFKLAFLAEI